jgi:hypothetical protein
MTTNGGVKPPVVRLKRAPEPSAVSAVFHPLEPWLGAGVKAKAFWIGTSAKAGEDDRDGEERLEHK